MAIIKDCDEEEVTYIKMKSLNPQGLMSEENFCLRTSGLRTEFRSLKSRNMSPGSVVHIVTKLGTGDSGVSIPGGVKIFFLSTKFPNRLWGHSGILNNE